MSSRQGCRGAVEDNARKRTRIAFGACSEISAVSPLIPMVLEIRIWKDNDVQVRIWTRGTIRRVRPDYWQISHLTRDTSQRKGPRITSANNWFHLHTRVQVNAYRLQPELPRGFEMHLYLRESPRALYLVTSSQEESNGCPRRALVFRAAEDNPYQAVVEFLPKDQVNLSNAIRLTSRVVKGCLGLICVTDGTSEDPPLSSWASELPPTPPQTSSLLLLLLPRRLVTPDRRQTPRNPWLRSTKSASTV